MPRPHARKYLQSKLISFLESSIRFETAGGLNDITEELCETLNPIGRPLKSTKYLFIK